MSIPNSNIFSIYNKISREEISNENLRLELFSHFLDHSAGVRDKTEIILNDFQKSQGARIFCIDGTAYSSNVDIITDSNIDKKEILLPSGIDGVILDTKVKSKIILPVADCAPIAAYHRSGDMIGLFHGGYKGVAGELDDDLGILVSMFENLKVIGNTNDINGEFDFHIGPMMGDDFELPKDYVVKIFGNLCKEFKLNINDYIKPSSILPYSSKKIDDNDKIFLNLRQIIIDVFKIYGIKLRKTSNKHARANVSNISTNSLKSYYPSYRLFSTLVKKIGLLEKHLKENFIDLNLDDIEKLKSDIKMMKGGNYSNFLKYYKNDYRLAYVLCNFNNKGMEYVPPKI